MLQHNLQQHHREILNVMSRFKMDSKNEACATDMNNSSPLFQDQRILTKLVVNVHYFYTPCCYNPPKDCAEVDWEQFSRAPDGIAGHRRSDFWLSIDPGWNVSRQRELAGCIARGSREEREEVRGHQWANSRGRSNAVHGNSWIHNRGSSRSENILTQLPDMHINLTQELFSAAAAPLAASADCRCCPAASIIIHLHTSPLPRLPHAFLNTPTEARHAPIGWQWHHLSAKCRVRPPPAQPHTTAPPWVQTWCCML